MSFKAYEKWRAKAIPLINEVNFYWHGGKFRGRKKKLRELARLIEKGENMLDDLDADEYKAYLYDDVDRGKEALAKHQTKNKPFSSEGLLAEIEALETVLKRILQKAEPLNTDYFQQIQRQLQGIKSSCTLIREVVRGAEQRRANKIIPCEEGA